MKTIFISLFTLVVVIFVGCIDIEDLEQEQILTNDIEAVERAPDGSSVTIWIACWDEWGRTSRDCNGWGLCNYESCWAWQDPCCGYASFPSAGSSQQLDDQGVGLMYQYISSSQDTSYKFEIALSLGNAEQKVAIENQDTLYIDYDIVDITYHNNQQHKVILEEGAYEFNPNVGPNGGYQFEVTYSIE